MRTLRSGGMAPPFLTSVLDGCEWSASRPCHYTRGKRAPRYPLDRRLGGPHIQSGRCGEEKNLALPGLELGPSSPQPVPIPTELSRLLNKKFWEDPVAYFPFTTICVFDATGWKKKVLLCMHNEVCKTVRETGAGCYKICVCFCLCECSMYRSYTDIQRQWHHWSLK
jgi:hypothetical protein